jgi:hypothetical protein
LLKKKNSAFPVSIKVQYQYVAQFNINKKKVGKLATFSLDGCDTALHALHRLSNDYNLVENKRSNIILGQIKEQ